MSDTRLQELRRAYVVEPSDENIRAYVVARRRVDPEVRGFKLIHIVKPRTYGKSAWRAELEEVMVPAGPCPSRCVNGKSENSWHLGNECSRCRGTWKNRDHFETMRMDAFNDCIDHLRGRVLIGRFKSWHGGVKLVESIK